MVRKILLLAMRRYSNTVSNIEISRIPTSRYEDVLNHVTPIFLRDEPLSKCFPPCSTGRREKAFREYATAQLNSGMCVMALDGNRVVGSCLNRQLHRDDIMAEESSTDPEADPLLSGVVSLLTSVHRQLDLFTVMGVNQLFELGVVSVEQSHAGRGLATKLLKASLDLGAEKGFTAVKADATGPASAKACQKVGLTPIYKLPYKNFKINDEVVFKNTDSMLTVLAGKLQNHEPHVLPVTFNFSKL